MRTRILGLLFFAFGVGLFATASAGAVPPAACDHRANNTPSKLVECITRGDLMAHMQAFQDIADANPGADGHPSRNSGEPGYKASADYVAKAMKDAGYDVTIQTYKFFYFAFTAIPTFSEVSPVPHAFTLNNEWAQARAPAPRKALSSNRPAASFFRRLRRAARRVDAPRSTSVAAVLREKSL
jgi:hypothetical protein